MSEEVMFYSAVVLTASTLKVGLLVGINAWRKKYVTFDDPFEKAFQWLHVEMEGRV